jgi:hypothetical protein
MPLKPLVEEHVGLSVRLELQPSDEDTVPSAAPMLKMTMH